MSRLRLRWVVLAGALIVLALLPPPTVVVAAAPTVVATGTAHCGDCGAAVLQGGCTIAACVAFAAVIEPEPVSLPVQASSYALMLRPFVAASPPGPDPPPPRSAGL